MCPIVPVISSEMQTLSSRPCFAELFRRSMRKFSKRCAFSTAFSANQSRGGLPRFYSEVLPHSKGDVVRVQGDEFWHMTKVLRLNVDDRVELFNGTGGIIEGCIQRVDRTGLDFLALEDLKIVLPKGTQWHVFAAFGTLKGGRADWLVEKCTELGASSVTPLLTERSPSIMEHRVERLQRVVLAATKQCQRLHEMTLNPPTRIKSLLPIVAQANLSFLAIAEAAPLVKSLILSTKVESGLLIIGPEGDFTEEETKLMTEAGATAVGLGPCRLRVETATIALLAALMLWSDSQDPQDTNRKMGTIAKLETFLMVPILRLPVAAITIGEDRGTPENGYFLKNFCPFAFSRDAHHCQPKNKYPWEALGESFCIVPIFG